MRLEMTATQASCILSLGKPYAEILDCIDLLELYRCVHGLFLSAVNYGAAA